MDPNWIGVIIICAMQLTASLTIKLWMPTPFGRFVQRFWELIRDGIERALNTFNRKEKP